MESVRNVVHIMDCYTFFESEFSLGIHFCFRFFILFPHFQKGVGPVSVKCNLPERHYRQKYKLTGCSNDHNRRKFLCEPFKPSLTSRKIQVSHDALNNSTNRMIGRIAALVKCVILPVFDVDLLKSTNQKL